MTKNKRSSYSRSKKRLVLATIILVVLISLFVGSVFNDWAQILKNKRDVEKLTVNYKDLQEEEDSLQLEVKKLQDTDYIARYAREKFLYSKDDGEIILRLPDMESKEDN